MYLINQSNGSTVFNQFNSKLWMKQILLKKKKSRAGNGPKKKILASQKYPSPISFLMVRLFLAAYRKKEKMENPGVDPGTSRMLSGRSTIWANPPKRSSAHSMTSSFLITGSLRCRAIKRRYTRVSQVRLQLIPYVVRIVYFLIISKHMTVNRIIPECWTDFRQEKWIHSTHSFVLQLVFQREFAKFAGGWMSQPDSIRMAKP